MLWTENKIDSNYDTPEVLLRPGLRDNETSRWKVVHNQNPFSFTRFSRLFPRALTLFTVLASLFITAAQAEADPPRLSSNTAIATAGFYQLHWQSEAAIIELQESASPDFTEAITLYKGPDQSTLVSGKPDGNWHYRARSVSSEQAGAWSQILQVSVAHHSLSRAGGFFLLGLLVFIGTTILIIRGSRKPE